MSGTYLGPYRLEKLLGSGAMGEVYRAVDIRHGRQVALKCLPARLRQEPRFRARFRTEASAVAALRHPNVVPIHEVGVIDDRPFIDMQLIDGVDLRTELVRSGGRLDCSRAVSIVAQVASALDAAHAAAIVHRDVKPSNVLLDITGATAYLIDFGLARYAADTRVTESGVAVGTLAYMAPERFDGRGDHRVDVYALACLLHELLTGRLPFPTTDLPSLMYAHMSMPPPRPSSIARGVPAALDAVVARGMHKDPARRFQRAGDLARAALAALGSTHLTVPATPPTQRASFRPEPLRHAPSEPARARKNRPSLRLVSLGTVVLLGGLIAGLAVAGATLEWVGPPTPVALPGAPRVAVVEEVPVGTSPRNLAVTGDGQHLYTTNREDNTVSVIDTRTGRVLRTLPVGADSGPEGIAVAPSGTTAYVVNNSKDTVGVLNTTSGHVQQTIPVDGFPTDVAVAPDGRTAYVTAQTTGIVLAIDTSDTGAIPRTLVATGGRPQSLAVSRDGRTIYVTDGGLDALLIVDATSGAISAEIAVGPGPDGVTVSPDGRTAYVVNIDGDSLSVVDLATSRVRTTIPVGTRPIAVAIHPDGRTAYVTNNESGTISVIDTDTDTVIDSVIVGSSPEAVTVAPDGRRIYTVNEGDDTLSIIEPAA